MSDAKKEGGVLSIAKDTLALVIITLVAAVLLGFVREITAEPIAKRAEEDKQKAYLAAVETQLPRPVDLNHDSGTGYSLVDEGGNHSTPLNHAPQTSKL